MNMYIPVWVSGGVYERDRQLGVHFVAKIIWPNFKSWFYLLDVFISFTKNSSEKTVRLVEIDPHNCDPCAILRENGYLNSTLDSWSK